MKILVTGGLGFIGSNLCRYILNKHSECNVINLDKIGVGANPANLRDLGKGKKYRFIKGDVCNQSLVDKIVKQADAIVNIAAETHVDRSIVNPKAFIRNNTVGTFTVLEAIRKHNRKCRLVQVSTDEVYGEISEGSFSEENALEPSNPYSASKASADMFVLAYCKTYDINACVTRCTNNFGPYQFPEKLVPKTTIRALKNLTIPVYGSGKNIRDWLFVLDHCEAIDTVREKGKRSEIYNVSSGNEVRNLDLVKQILHLVGKEEVLISFVEDRPGHDFRYSLDSSKLRSELGWKPKFTFKSALEKTVNWYKDNNAWWQPLATKEVLEPTPWK